MSNTQKTETCRTKFCRSYRSRLPVVIIACATMLSIQIASAQLVQLRTHAFDPLATATRSTPTELAEAQDGRAAYILQTHRPLSDADWHILREAGVERVSYIPDSAWLITLSPANTDKIHALPVVRWLGSYEAAYKIEPTMSATTRSDTSREVVISILRQRYLNTVADAVTAAGGEVKEQGASKRWGTIHASLPENALTSLAAMAEVEWIEPFIQPTVMNDVARKPSLMNVEKVWDTQGLYGSGQIVAVGDSGLDVGNIQEIHPDFQGRIHAAFGLVQAENWADALGHGTHVAGSVLGSGAAFENGRYSGMAPRAKLVMQAMGVPGSPAIYTPSPLNLLFEQARDHGAHIHTDSWGSAGNGLYTASSRATDEFMWDYDDMLVLFSAGNSGVDADQDGIIDPMSMGDPASAKNVLTVGASESDRPAGSGGYSSNVWGRGNWLKYYPVNPIRDDLISTSADSLNQGMAAFSSRGPTQDGRTKPDIVAPGTDIISARSQHPSAFATWGAVPGDAGQWYTFMGGTSMATPLTAGVAALAREYLTTRRNLANPSAALQKALLVNGAKSIAPGQYGTGIFQEIPTGSRPNNVEGWGQVDLAHTLFPEDGSTNIFWDRHLLQTGQTNRYPIIVADTTTPVRITLAWSDYPASLGAARQLVNDLDLRLVTPTGQTLYPSGKTQPDRRNNLVGIDWDAPHPGTNWIEIVGYNVPFAPQKYSLVVKGNVNAQTGFDFYGLWQMEPLFDNRPPRIAAKLEPGANGVWAAALYWRNNGDAWQTVIMTPDTAASSDNTFAATLPTLAAGDEIEYYAVALDFAMNTVTSRTESARVNSSTLYVNPDGTAQWPYNSLVNALQHPQDAIDLAADGNTVLVAAGTYAGKTIFVDREITMAGIDGPAATIIDGENLRRCIEITADATVYGFTFRNGVTPSDGGAVWMSNGQLTDCLIENSRALRYGGGLNLMNGLVQNVRITGNRADDHGGGVVIRGGTILNAAIHDNTSEADGGGIEFWGGEVSNCTIAWNHAEGYGGGVDIGDYGTMLNNIIVSNTAAEDGDNWYDWGFELFTYTLTTPVPDADGCFYADPHFADPDARDFQLQSAAGRYTATGIWTNDPVSSPAIDMGAPASTYENEPAPNGSRVNLGAYGNTILASKGSDTHRQLLVYTSPDEQNPDVRTAAIDTTLTVSLASTEWLHGTTQYVHTGWSLANVTDANSRTSGTNTSLQIPMQANGVLRWLWNTNYHVSAQSSGAGSIAHTNGWYASGSFMQLRATPEPYYALESWTGTITSAQNPLVILVNKPYDLSAIFTPMRTARGTPHAWLAQWGWTNQFDLIELEDSDGNGIPNWQEYVAGTNPLDPTSRLAIQLLPNGSRTDLRWQAKAGRRYRLIHTENLIHGPTRILSEFQAFSDLDLAFPMPTNSADSGFFWIEVEAP